MILLFTIIAALVLVLSSCSTMAIPQGLFVCQDPYIYYATAYEFPDGEEIEQRSEMELNNKIQRIIILFSDYQLTFSTEYDAHLYGGKTSFVLTKVQ